ncbi:DUF3291 domain-containing protein [Sulfitobacter mediterraneus]|uniref:DUF3291 domain-containing protein n=1 Tax=Sulfitobacter mediterraneus TaxID=83219 RepID=UPI00193185CF|nr:DUF3291 domain-containing protein [Sulfitobacter mediterraneus]MBM1309291.1 DUF3291 domain-containing protein [Sulfitobacter mediterraneus]MBM1313176.1 DUF3291 domain-containing protein [Sulfitobacter mediterraneus]MBM1321560.1 DUF3291 domain-containing protein [Sulfitobacter mediterraneus]MBM1325447.1 DUF3291 domain-containing protein [Sulfitobacter mediterraneus]MBM1396793.1 DUF3291 domain-containing protein [Sulfitobacter mediterraneus]
MQHPAGHHLAELNLGILKYDWDDPRVQDFVNGLDLVNGVAQRAPGFVWMMNEETMDSEQNDPEGAMGGNPRMASTLSVWESVETLEHFVWNTVHKRFYDRKDEWYDMGAALRFVMWWVPEGHRPTMAEAMERFRHLEKHGESDFAFGWSSIKSAELWKTKACGSGQAA